MMITKHPIGGKRYAFSHPLLHLPRQHAAHRRAQGEREVKLGYLPPLKPMDIDLDRYDTIVLGTPVWWYTCSPAMRAFLTAHDISGKTVYPFATNGGWLGRSIRDMRALCPGAAFRPGLDVLFDDTTQRTPDADVDRWIAAIHD